MKDPFTPPDEFWQWLPDAQYVAMDSDGAVYWYGMDIQPGEEGAWVWAVKANAVCGFCFRYDVGDFDWRNTKRVRPAHL